MAEGGGKVGEVRVEVKVDPTGVRTGMAEAKAEVATGAAVIGAQTDAMSAKMQSSLKGIGKELKESVSGFHFLAVGIARVAGVIGLAVAAGGLFIKFLDDMEHSVSRSRDRFNELSDQIERTFRGRSEGLLGELQDIEDQLTKTLDVIRKDKTLKGHDSYAAFRKAEEEAAAARERVQEKEYRKQKEIEQRKKLDAEAKQIERDAKSTADAFDSEDTLTKALRDWNDREDQRVADEKVAAKEAAENMARAIEAAAQKIIDAQNQFTNQTLSRIGVDISMIRTMATLRQPTR